MRTRGFSLRRRLSVPLLAAVAFTATAAAPVSAPRSSPQRQAFLERFARAYFPGRTGQILVVPRQGHIITKRDPTVTYMHGSPWPYDTRIPFLISGPAFVRPGTYPGPVAQEDMAPTLAALLGVSMPGTSTGRPQRAILKPGTGRPRLIVLAVLDGMRVDYFDRHASVLPTLTRLRKQGAWFSNAEVSLLPSITSVGHATIATGALPRVHGIVANALFDRIAGQATDVYPGLSPRLLMALTLADAWNLETDGRAIIIGQGSTPRAAVALAGHGACVLNGRPVIAASYNEKTGAWETNSECYRLPDYLKDRNARAVWDATNGVWMGHPIGTAGDVRYSAVFSKFETDALNLMIEREPLGADDVTDLVLVNLKTPDYVGHRYGPDSPELHEALGALDRDLAAVIAALDAKVGRERYVVAITADHGMPPEPDERRGQARHYTDDIVKMIHDKFDPGQGKLVKHYEPENAQIAIDRARLRELGLSLDALGRYLEAQPFIFAAYTEQEVGRAAAALGR
jgi:hypothetical protein